MILLSSCSREKKSPFSGTSECRINNELCKKGFHLLHKFFAQTMVHSLYYNNISSPFYLLMRCLLFEKVPMLDYSLDDALLGHYVLMYLGNII